VIVERERKRNDNVTGGLVVPKVECGTPAITNFDTVDECSDDDDELEHRQWRSKAAAPRTAGFVDHDTTSSRHTSHPHAAGIPRKPSNEWNQNNNSQGSPSDARQAQYAANASYSESGQASNHRSPTQHHTESHRMPYFRYFGPTAIVPGFKQMVVNVYRDRRKSRGGSFSTASPGSLFGHGTSHNLLSHHETILETLEDLPVYDVNAPGPIHPLIVSLVDTFFHHLGCNYLFLRKDRFVRLLNEKRIEPILVDSVCALAARFSEQPIFTNEQDGKLKRSEYGNVFAQRAKSAIVDTFPCPSVGAVQACLLMAYESFGANQDSALWMYLGCAIRMTLDLGLQKMEGVKYQGERDPWYTRCWSRKSDDGTDGQEGKQNEETLSPKEQREVEQERIDTFWAVFVLDRVISSGTGRPVTFRDDDYELALPAPSTDPVTGWPAPFPTFIEIIHLYGRVSDVLNNIRNASDLTGEKMARLARMESDLTALYQKQDERLHFNAVNFREYVKTNQATTFILLHFWFHALIIVLHQPTLLTPFHNLKPAQLLTNSRELSMSSAKTIADILAFAELIDPKSFIGNPFTSQPIYIAACAFLMESVANASQAPSREPSPSCDAKGDHAKVGAGRYGSGSDPRHVKHSLLASAANQNYQRCYKSLQQLEQYWEGVRYIINALDQKSKGIWDCETYTIEEYEAIKLARRGSFGRLPRFDHPASPNVPPIAYSLTGTTNSPSSNLTVLFQSNPTQSGNSASSSLFPPPPPPAPPPPPSVPTSAATPPGNMIYDPIRQSLPETPPAFPPPYPQPNVSAVRYQPHPSKPSRLSQSPASAETLIKYESSSPSDMGPISPSNDHKSHSHGTVSRSGHGSLHQPSYHHSAHHHSAYESSAGYKDSLSTSPTDSNMGQQRNHNSHDNGMDQSSSYEADFAQSGLASGSYSYMGLNPINDIITFNSQEVNIDMLGLQSEILPPWLEILPGDILGGLFEGGMAGASQGHMG
jgi:hypothetical protein